MVFALSTAVSVLLVFVGGMIVAALVSGRLFDRHGSSMGEHGGRGERIPDPPGFAKPPRDGGL